jgi:hypothetical protein
VPTRDAEASRQFSLREPIFFVFCSPIRFFKHFFDHWTARQVGNQANLGELDAKSGSGQKIAIIGNWDHRIVGWDS